MKSPSNMVSSHCGFHRVRVFATGVLFLHVHTGYIEVIMQGKCGRNTETTFDTLLHEMPSNLKGKNFV